MEIRDLKIGKKFIEGKTKIIYEHMEDPSKRIMIFKDDITAGDGIKHDLLEGKALIDWRTNKDIFEYLSMKGVRTHYLYSPCPDVSIIRSLDRKINLEVVSRRVATGSIVRWTDIPEGTKFDPLVHQFHYKDDSLHDPMLEPRFVNYLIEKKNGNEYAEMQAINNQVFLILEEAFANFNIQLIDIKLEYGTINGEVYLIDEITGGSFRLWPYAKDNPNLKISNVIYELDPTGRLDKDNYRMGKDLDKVKNKFEEIANITAKFKDL